MGRGATRAEAVRRAKELGFAEVPADWRGCDAVWDVFEAMADAGSVVVIKLDGGRNAPGDNGRYTVVVSGGPLGEDVFRVDTRVLEEGLAGAIVHFARKCRGV